MSEPNLIHLHQAIPATPHFKMGPYSLNIKAGEKIAVLGPSGAGKSSLLKLFAGDYPLASGEATFFNKPLKYWSIEELSHRRAVLPQSYDIAFDLNVRLIIGLGRISRSQDIQHTPIITAAAQLAQADHLLHRQFNTLSGGEKARVQLARVFAQLWDIEQGLLLIDEPLASLDPGLQLELLEAFNSFSEQRAHTVIAVLHDINQAFQHFERWLCVKQGQIVEDIPCALSHVNKLENLYGGIQISIAKSDDGKIWLGSTKR